MEKAFEVISRLFDRIEHLENVIRSVKKELSNTEAARSSLEEQLEEMEELVIRDKTAFYEPEDHGTGHCPKCGKYVFREDHFCSGCGQRIEAADATD